MERTQNHEQAVICCGKCDSVLRFLSDCQYDRRNGLKMSRMDSVRTDTIGLEFVHRTWRILFIMHMLSCSMRRL